MESRKDLIAQMVSHEWEFFSTVNNIGGQASCQRMPDTFSIMRTAWFSIWPDEALESYSSDLAVAGMEGRNPLSEKYGYMMESTSPEEYARIADLLPPVSAEKSELVEALLRIEVAWAEEMTVKYPRFRGQGRPLYSSEDGLHVTSLETYSRGELKTYSLRTLRALLASFGQAAEAGVNLQERSDTIQVQMQGYSSLDEAERTLAARQG